MRVTCSTGSPESSCGETKTSMEPSRDNAIWLTSPGTGIANSRGSFASGRRTRSQVATATVAGAISIATQTVIGNLRGEAAVGGAALVSVPDGADSANDIALHD